jgi:2-iminobutanoate/2-iminopropanoate deaminase
MPTHRIVHADNIPAPAGPYSPATVFERLVFVAGQGARVPATGSLASLDIEAQTEQCLRNVETILWPPARACSTCCAAACSSST